jgi:aspartyl-tRNA(Asn)/glutamyl-tRNA(Gln) amidotransferase subunit C
MSEVTHEDVQRVAELANLELTADEVPRMARDLTAVLGHIAQLSELDTSTVAPMAQVADVLNPSLGLAPNSDGATLRLDQVSSSIDRKAVMAQAPETDGRFFKVPKVIER